MHITLPPTDRERALERLRNYLPGKRVTVEAREWKPERSKQQNRALWGAAYKALRKQTGNDPEDLHTWFCGSYFGWTEYEVMGDVRKRPRRTTTRDEDGHIDVLSWDDFSDFYGHVQRVAAEAGYQVPDPDPAWRTCVSEG